MVRTLCILLLSLKTCLNGAAGEQTDPLRVVCSHAEIWFRNTLTHFELGFSVTLNSQVKWRWNGKVAESVKRDCLTKVGAHL